MKCDIDKAIPLLSAICLYVVSSRPASEAGFVNSDLIL